MSDCIFCQIVAGKVESWKVYETDSAYAFLDIHPDNLRVLAHPAPTIAYRARRENSGRAPPRGAVPGVDLNRLNRAR